MRNPTNPATDSLLKYRCKFMNIYTTKSQEETEVLGANIAATYASSGKPITFALYGDLGSGKTAFSRGFIRHLVGDENLSVSSPTFVLLNSYKAKNGMEIRHMDLYRLKHPEEIYDLDIHYAFDNCINLIEWPEIIENKIPDNITKIRFSTEEDNRTIEIS